MAFVDLRALTDPGLMLPAVADALAVQESTGSDLLERVIDTLLQAPALLVVDNFEHLLRAAPLLSDVLACVSLVKVLATSRERLNLRWEHVRTVHPLDVDRTQPGAVSASAHGPAVELFPERARAVQPDLQADDATIRTIRDLCHALDGLPLAIELAAGRFGSLPLPELMRRLGTNPALLSGPRDAPDRHQTLERAIAWSYDLLSGARMMWTPRTLPACWRAWWTARWWYQCTTTLCRAIDCWR